MSLLEIVRAARESAVLFDMASRGWIEVRGDDRVRWLDGMISGDVNALVEEGVGAGCYATLLTNRGKIVADMHVGHLGDAFVLESLASEIPNIRASLNKFIIADDVDLIDMSDSQVALGLEGPQAAAILAAALGGAEPPRANDWRTGSLGGRDILMGAFGFSGESAFQIRIAKGDQAEVEAALDSASETGSILRGDSEALEVLRIEAGIPALTRELDDEVLPPEARLEHAISTTKGCYVGQEIVARLRSRGQVNHLLVGLHVEAGLASEGATLMASDKRTGEITSVAASPTQGPIALAYVRREHSEAGTIVEFEGGRARVAALPFVVAGSIQPGAPAAEAN